MDDHLAERADELLRRATALLREANERAEYALEAERDAVAEARRRSGELVQQFAQARAGSADHAHSEALAADLERLREELSAYERDAEELQEDVAALHDEVEHERAGSDEARLLKELRGE